MSDTTETPISREAVELVADAISQSATLGNSGDGDVWLDNSMEIAQAAISAILASGEVVSKKEFDIANRLAEHWRRFAYDY